MIRVEKTTREKISKNINQKKIINSQFLFNNNLRLIDYTTFFYLGVISILLLFFHDGVNQWPLLILTHFFVVGVLIALINYVGNKGSFKPLIFLRDSYPVFLYSFMFIEINIIMNIIFPFWLEKWLLKWDFAIFGGHPTVMVQSIFTPWLSEFMAFSYWSYYILIPLTGILLYLNKNRSLFHSYIFNLSFILYCCYFLFLFLSARGPHDTLAHLHSGRLMAGFFDSFVQSIQNQASVAGAAFPSSHVAAVWVAWIFLTKFKKWLGWIVLPLIISLSFSVVYMQYHYAVDSIAGILLVCVIYPFSRLLEEKIKLVSAQNIIDP